MKPALHGPVAVRHPPSKRITVALCVFHWSRQVLPTARHLRTAASSVRGFPGLLALAMLVCAVSLVAPGLAASDVYTPPTKQIWTGVSDTGNIADYNNFVSAVGKHEPIMETFKSWGSRLGSADNRWDAAKVRPMLHISTAEGGQPEKISPGQIANGEGDDYLIRLNADFGGGQRIAYIRPFGEMNGSHNPYCAFNANGSKRDSNHSTTQFKRAWKRIVIIVRGGGRRSEIDARLAAQGLPPLNPQDGTPPPPPLPGESEPYFMQAPVSFVWTPQLRNEPNVKGNRPSAYWPGGQWVDWTGTDIFSNSADFKMLDAFYKKQRRHKPFVIGEWAVALSDNAGFVKNLMGWAKGHGAVRMVVYYQGFAGDAYRPYHYPKAVSQLRKQLRPSRFPAFTPENTF